MKRSQKVLIFPGGTEIGLEIWRALKDCRNMVLYSAGSNVSNHAPYVFKNHFLVPDVHCNNWDGVLSNIINTYRIDYIFPAHDDVVMALAQNADKFNADVLSSPFSTCSICRSKTKTYNKFRHRLPVPKIFNKLSEIDAFPVFVKLDEGQGSQGACRADDPDTLKVLLKNNPDLITLEYLSGKEYTVDCFTDRRKGLLFCGGRERIRSRSGIAMNSKPVDKKINRICRKYADIISRELELYGAWFFQLKLDRLGVFRLLEIAPRISGTMATHRVLGLNFPLLTLYEKQGVNIEVMLNDHDVEIDRALVNRYRHNLEYDKVYVDLDDTLIINRRVNTLLVRFLYQAVNEGCKIILMSKSTNDVECVLKKWRLTSLFDKVVLLKKSDSKADLIDPKGAIFIDDSFSERKAVADRHKIPAFDCSMIELLIDERV